MSYHRDELKRDGDRYAADWADCGTCQRRMSRYRRAQIGCGWVPKAERGAYPMATPAGPEATVCVGYTAMLPEVLEASRALGWRMDGHLTEFYDGEPVTPILRDALDVLAGERKQVEVYALTPKDGK